MKFSEITTKTIAAALSAVMLLSSVCAVAEDAVKVYVDGQQLEFDVNPVIDNDRTLVPLRAIFEALGADVQWDGDTRTATASKDENTVSITIDSNKLYKNGTEVELDVPAKIVDDRTMVPVRAISESFDANVEWNGETRSVEITTKSVETADDNQQEITELEVPEQLVFTDEDAAYLDEQKYLIRYGFEQMWMPRNVFENADSFYEKQLSSSEDFTEEVKKEWKSDVMTIMLEVVAYSDHTYVLPGDERILTFFDYETNHLNLNFEDYFESVKVYENDDDVRVGVITFKEVDSIDCKYIGVIAAPGKAPRYFTAENDITLNDLWFFCEVMQDENGELMRSTLTYFEKEDDETDVNTFCNYCLVAYEMK